MTLTNAKSVGGEPPFNPNPYSEQNGVKTDILFVLVRKPSHSPPIELARIMAKTRYFQLVDGKSNKFWHIQLDGHEHTATYGRIGSAGTSGSDYLLR